LWGKYGDHRLGYRGTDRYEYRNQGIVARSNSANKAFDNATLPAIAGSWVLMKEGPRKLSANIALQSIRS
jgi:hypothetical protein